MRLLRHAIRAGVCIHKGFSVRWSSSHELRTTLYVARVWCFVNRVAWFFCFAPSSLDTVKRIKLRQFYPFNDIFSRLLLIFRVLTHLTDGFFLCIFQQVSAYLEAPEKIFRTWHRSCISTFCASRLAFYVLLRMALRIVTYWHDTCIWHGSCIWRGSCIARKHKTRAKKPLLETT